VDQGADDVVRTRDRDQLDQVARLAMLDRLSARDARAKTRHLFVSVAELLPDQEAGMTLRGERHGSRSVERARFRSRPNDVDNKRAAATTLGSRKTA
jgi:hypothetical protein